MTTTAATTISDLATATPVEIDTEIARLEGLIMQLAGRIAASHRTIDRYQKRRASEGMWPDVVEECDQVIADAHANISECSTQQDTLAGQVAPLHAEYHRRGGWTRYYLVDANNGHVHSSMGCSSCFPTTAYYWLVTESGKDAEQVVSEAGSQACTVCFPWAPVDAPRGSYRTPTQAEAEARAAEKAAKAAAKKAAEITTPDGGELYAAATDRDGKLCRDSLLRTEASAWRRALSDAEALAFYGSSHPHAAAWIETINRCVAALAVRRGVSEQSLRDQIAAKNAAKAKRDGWVVKS